MNTKKDSEYNNLMKGAKLSAEEDLKINYCYSLNNFIGKTDLKNNLYTYIKSAKTRKEPLDHLLIYGPPGLGKTTLAHTIAYEMSSNIHILHGPTIQKTGDIASQLTRIKSNDIIFIDEIHRIKSNIAEMLYNAMEYFKLDIIIGQGIGTKSVRLNINKFTLIGATTSIGSLSQAFYSRFGIIERLDYYSPKELTEIIMRANINKSITPKIALEIGKRSRGTPRIALRLSKRIRDFAITNNNNIIDQSILDSSFKNLQIDENGLDIMDKRLLRTIIQDYQGGPVGLQTLSISINENIETIQDIYEPYLIQKGYLARTPRGRITTVKSYKYFKIERDKKNED